MDWRPLAGRVALVVAAMLSLASCGEDSFPIKPTPLVTGDVTTLGGGNWSGDILLSDGALTSFNMTLIARSLGQDAGVHAAAQAPRTTEVSGNFKLGTGLTGGVQGVLQGTLQNGTFDGTLSSSSPACSRSYSGPITESTVAWIARGSATTPACPLTFSIQLPRPLGPGCQYVVSFSQQAFSGNGGSGAVVINTGPVCAWAAESLDPWLIVNDTEPKLGAGRVTFSVAANGTGSREGRLRLAVANQTFLVNQGPACSYSVSPTAVAASGGGGSGTIAVTAVTGCEWTTQTSVPWVIVTPAAGAGSGTVSYTVQSNTGPARSGSFVVAGQTISVAQDASCGATVTPTDLVFAAGGGSGAVTINAPAGCAWSSTPGDGWIVLGATRNGTGPGRIDFTVQANGGPARTGSFIAAGQSVAITQAAGCTYTMRAESTIQGSGLLSGSMSSIGDQGNVTVTASDPTCQWTLAGSAPWITFDEFPPHVPISGAPSKTGTGVLTFTYLVGRNTSNVAPPPPTRSGTVVLSGDGVIAVRVTFDQIGEVIVP